jgi:hypothetical protein
LRTTATAVLTAPVGDIVPKDSLAEAVQAEAPARFNPSTLDKIARNAASSWTQAGHLQGHRIKRRARPKATSATVAYALVLGYLAGASGQFLLNTFWTRILDLPADRLIDILTDTSGAPAAMKGRGPVIARVLGGAPLGETAFGLNAAKKDLACAVQFGASIHAELPVTASALACYEEAEAAGLGDADATAVSTRWTQRKGKS